MLHYFTKPSIWLHTLQPCRVLTQLCSVSLLQSYLHNKICSLRIVVLYVLFIWQSVVFLLWCFHWLPRSSVVILWWGFLSLGYGLTPGAELVRPYTRGADREDVMKLGQAYTIESNSLYKDAMCHRAIHLKPQTLNCWFFSLVAVISLEFLSFVSSLSQSNFLVPKCCMADIFSIGEAFYKRSRLSLCRENGACRYLWNQTVFTKMYCIIQLFTPNLKP